MFGESPSLFPARCSKDFPVVRAMGLDSIEIENNQQTHKKRNYG